MANTHVHTRPRPSHRRDAKRGIRWMSDRQLDAYLQTRETLRRLRALTSAVGPTAPPAAQG